MKKNQKWLILFVVLVLMAGTAGALTWLKANQRLGQPGIIATPIPGKVAMKIDLPEQVLDFTSTNVPESDEVLGYLPKDTSFVERCYTVAGRFSRHLCHHRVNGRGPHQHSPAGILSGRPGFFL